jgi:hypothetical protein
MDTPELGAALLGIDLTSVNRTLAREPAYQSCPQYCLLLVGPEGKTHIWLILDGEKLYVDRNGNGDLTEPGEVFLSPDQAFTVGDITEAAGGARHTNFRGMRLRAVRSVAGTEGTPRADRHDNRP